MSFCKKCGNQLADDVLFCSKCGTAVESAAVESAPEGIYTNQDSTNPDNSVYAAPFTDASIPEAPEAPSPVAAAAGEYQSYSSVPGAYPGVNTVQPPAFGDAQPQTFGGVQPPVFGGMPPTFAVDANPYYSNYSKSRKSKTGLIIGLVIGLVLLICVGGYFAISGFIGLGGELAVSGPAEEMQKVFTTYTDAVVDGDAAAMFRCYYETSDWNEADIEEKIAYEYDEYSYPDESAMCADWFDIFVYTYNTEWYEFAEGINSIKVTSFSTEVPEAPVDDEPVPCKAKMIVDCVSTGSETVEINFYMACRNGGWYILWEY